MLQQQQKINVDCIIPAAGLSSRMGKWKLLLPYKNSTIVEESIKNALSVCSRVILVAGYRADELIEKVGHYPNLDVIVNNNYQQGMYSSIREGVKHLKSDYFFVSHADMPCIQLETYLALWEKRNKGSVFPGRENKSGHPVLISSELSSFIINEKHHSSMKSLLTQFPVSFLHLTNSDMYFDVDTPESYHRLMNNT